jgi:uncharacterized protein (DUF934 family)
MSLLSDEGRILTDPWRPLPAGSGIPRPHTLLTVDQWRDRQAAVAVRFPVGLRVAGDEDADRVEPWLDRAALVDVRFTAFTDGRGFSLARTFRTQCGYSGPLRASGDILLDQLQFLMRCGFDQFLLRDGESIETARKTLRAFTLAYQPPGARRRPGTGSEPQYMGSVTSANNRSTAA